MASSAAAILRPVFTTVKTYPAIGAVAEKQLESGVVILARHTLLVAAGKEFLTYLNCVTSYWYQVGIMPRRSFYADCSISMPLFWGAFPRNSRNSITAARSSALP